MTFETIKTIWEKIPECENCEEKKCSKINWWEYREHCGNVHYLTNYGKDYYDRICESIKSFAQYNKNNNVTVLSMGCGACLEYIPLHEIFKNFVYYPIDCNVWPIRKTMRYKSFQIALPDESYKNNLYSFTEGLEILRAITNIPVICFFNSIKDILYGSTLNQRQELANRFADSVPNIEKFFVIVNHTRETAFSEYNRRQQGWQTNRDREDEFLQNFKARVLDRFTITVPIQIGDEDFILMGIRK